MTDAADHAETGIAVPLRREDEITADWLDAVLYAPSDGARLVAALQVKRWRAKPFSLLLRLTPSYTRWASDDLPRSFVLKLAKPGPASAAARRRRGKEHAFYGAVAPAMANPPLVRVRSLGFDPDSGAAHLLMDDLDASHTRPPRGLPPSPAQAEATVDALAEIHAAWWDHPQARDVLAHRDDAWFAARQGAARRAVDSLLGEFGEHLAPGMRLALVEAAAAYPDLLRELTERPATIVHGDAHAWNCLTPRAAGKPVLLDWEAWTVDTGAYDLASLIALRFDPETRRLLEPRLLARYHARLCVHAVADYPMDDLLIDYRRAVLRRVLAPAFQRRRGAPPTTWWNNLSRIALALADLSPSR